MVMNVMNKDEIIKEVKHAAEKSYEEVIRQVIDQIEQDKKDSYGSDEFITQDVEKAIEKVSERLLKRE